MTERSGCRRWTTRLKLFCSEDREIDEAASGQYNFEHYAGDPYANSEGAYEDDMDSRNDEDFSDEDAERFADGNPFAYIDDQTVSDFPTSCSTHTVDTCLALSNVAEGSTVTNSDLGEREVPGNKLSADARDDPTNVGSSTTVRIFPPITNGERDHESDLNTVRTELCAFGQTDEHEMTLRTSGDQRQVTAQV